MSRAIPNTREIKLFFHCANCLPHLPQGVSPQEWAQIECGWTELGFQVWCRRCNCNIIHVDFEGEKHRANVTRKLNEQETEAKAGSRH
jgi:hypothetical protein